MRDFLLLPEGDVEDLLAEEAQHSCGGLAGAGTPQDKEVLGGVYDLLLISVQSDVERRQHLQDLRE